MTNKRNRKMLDHKDKVCKTRGSVIGYVRNQCRRGAEYRNIHWGLPLKTAKIIIKQPCFYCKTVPIRYGGLDRVDNSQGYTLTNTVPCCMACNHWKGQDTVSDFIGHCHRVSEKCCIQE
jgi:hypothetical protein